MVLSFLLFFRDLPLSMSVQLKHLLWSTSELVICKHGIWDWFPYLHLKTLSWANDRKPKVARLQFFICDVLSLQWLCSNPEPKQLKQLGLSRFFGKQVNEGLEGTFGISSWQLFISVLHVLIDCFPEQSPCRFPAEDFTHPSVGNNKKLHCLHSVRSMWVPGYTVDTYYMILDGVLIKKQ